VHTLGGGGDESGVGAAAGAATGETGGVRGWGCAGAEWCWGLVVVLLGLVVKVRG
jgi:hypothetical protein